MATKKSKKKKTSKANNSGRTTKTSAQAKITEVVHWEIQAQDPKKLQSFYSGVFGWKIDANTPMQYGMVTSRARKRIEGGIGGSQGPGSRVLVYAQVASIPSTLKRMESKGGKTIMPRTDVGPVVIGLYRDPEGNTMGLIEG